MSRFDTGNPIGSADPRDRDDNSKNFDEALNSPSSLTWVDRFGVTRSTLRAGEIASQQVVDTADQAIEDINAQVDGLEGEVNNRLNEILIAGGQIFVSESSGRAQVQNGQNYLAANPDANIAYTIWNRVNATTSQKVADVPASEFVYNSITDVNIYFDDEIVYDSINSTISFPSGTAIKAKGSPGLKTFEAVTLIAPGEIPGGVISGAAYYYYFDYAETAGSPIKFANGIGSALPLQNGNLRKLGTLYRGNWSNSEFPFRAINQPRNYKTFLKNVIPNGNSDPRSESVSFYGDPRPASLDNSQLAVAPSALGSLGIEQAVHIDPNDPRVGNFLVYPIDWKTSQKPNILMAITVHKVSGEWEFGNYQGPFYYLAVKNSAGTVFNVENGPLEVLQEIDENTRVYGLSFVPQTNLNEGESFSQITLGMRSTSESEYYFGGFWTSLSAGVHSLFKPITLNETFWPRWGLVDRSFTPRKLEANKKPESGFNALVDSTINPFHSMQVRLIGDSITWGSGASGLAESQPRSQSLTDPRNNLTSRTWANLFRDYIGKWACSVLAERTDLGTGGSTDAQLMEIPPINPNTKFIHPKTQQEITPSTSTTYADSVPHGYTMTIRISDLPEFNYGCDIETTVIGDNIRFVFAQFNGTDTEANSMDVYVDGVYQESFSYVGNGAIFGVKSPIINFPFGKHKITLKLRAASTLSFRFEGFEFTHKVNFFNDGLIGSNTARWAPDGPVLPESIQDGDEVVFVQLGTNNRYGPNRKLFRSQLVAIVEYLLARNKKVILSASCVATVEDESREGVRDIHMNEVAATIKSVADEYKVDFINQYAYTLQHYLDGEDILPDDLHPNDAGHRIMFNNIKNALIAESQKGEW